MRPRGVFAFLPLAWVASLVGTCVPGARADSVIPEKSALRRAHTVLRQHHPAILALTQDVGDIALIEHDGSNYNHNNPDGSTNVEARLSVSNHFYEGHGDLYDDVVVFTNFPYDNASAVAWNFLVRNSVQGTGTPIVDNGSFFGSPARLGAYVDMGPIAQYRAYPFSLDPGQPGFDRTLGVLAHEFAHNWLARVRYLRDGTPSAGLLGQLGSHWSYLLGSDASFMYGSDWQPRPEGGYVASRVLEDYSPLDLYAMGFLDPQQVPPFTLLVNPAVDPNLPPVEDATLDAQPEGVDVSQVIGAEGPRLPDELHSQKAFRLAFVFLLAPGTEPTSEDLAAIDRIRQDFEARFFALTRAVAVVDTRLEDAPPGPPANGPDLDKALAWLLLAQSLDGSWNDGVGTAPRDTQAALQALLDAGQDVDSPYLNGLAWIRQNQPANLDYVARRAAAVAGSATSAERQAMLARILSQQNPDGGFGAGAGYASDALDTALALRALKALGYPLGARISQAIAVLALDPLRDPTGAFRGVRGGEVSNVVTASVMLALHDWMEAAPAQALLGPAGAALSARRNADGGFGESPSTPYATALALEALLGAGMSGEVIEGAVAWIESHQLVDGSWDQRRFDTAVVLHALKGSTLPNLTLSPNDMVVDPASAHEGDVVTVAAGVRNVGHVASPVTLARLYFGPPGPGTAVADAALPAIEAGGQASVTFSFDTAGHAGDLFLYAVADPDNAVPEVREDDNTASRPLHVEGPLPDLAIAPSGLEVPPYPVEQGEVLHFDVTVRNAGALAAPPSQLQVVDHGPQGQTVMVASLDVPVLVQGASFHLALAWDTQNAAFGSHTLAALADATFAIQELDEENNLAQAPVTVVPPQPPGPDLDVASVIIAPPALVSIPQDVAVSVLVHNFGQDAAASVVALYLDAPGGTLLGEQPVDLASHTSVTLTFPLTLDTGGSRTFVAVADPDGSLPETDETNNVAAGVLDDPGNVLDIEVLPQDVTLSATDLTVGDRLDVTVVVHNRGTRPFESVPVILGHVDGGNVGELARAYASLAPGASTTLVLSWITSILGDPVPLVVEADPFGLLDEVNEDNNNVPLVVRVSPSTLPNLRITGQDIAFSPDPPLEGADATVSVVVHNPGAVAAGPFNVRFYLGDPDAGGVVLGDTPVPGVGAGAAATASMLWSPVTVHGAQGIFVIADASNAVAEYDETDNRAFRPFAVVGLPDLVLAAADVSLEPSYPRVGEPVVVHASVRNLGGLPAAESVLRAVEGEGTSALVVGEVVVPALAVGATAEIDLGWTPGSPPGLRLLSLTADANGTIVEGDEGNNLARLSVVVQDADLYLTEPYFSPNGDGVKDTTTLAFRTASASRVVVSDENGQAVRIFELEAIATGTVVWDGMDSRGLLVPDGSYDLTIEGANGALGRAGVVVDTDRSPIHDAAGTALKAVRTFPCPPGWALDGQPAFMPSEDEILTVVRNPTTGSFPGLVRASFDGQWSLVSGDSFFESAFVASSAAVSPDSRELLVLTFAGGLYAVDLASGDRRLVSSAASRGAWSPDGGFIASNSDVFQRDGTPVITLPSPDLPPLPPGYPSSGPAWAWSPDGEWLAWGPTVVRRNGDLRGVVLPDEVAIDPDQGNCAYLTSRETTWLPNGTLLFSVEAWTVGNEGGCDIGHTWHLQVLPGAQAATLYTGGWGSWSPDGRRVLYYTNDDVNPSRTVVSRSDGSLPMQLTPFYSVPTPRSTAAWYWADPAPGSACVGFGSELQALTSLQNLTVDLQAAVLPSNGGVLLRGTVSDQNLERYQIEWAASAAPDVWHPVGPGSSIPVLDDVLGVWVPPGPGTFVVRVHASDRAGNVRERVASVWWDHVPPITNVSQDEVLISPTGDGIKDVLTVSFLVLEPTTAAVVIRGPVAQGTDPDLAPIVREMSFDYPAIGPQSFVWDGRDGQGQLARDGRHVVFLNGLPLRVDVDATPPDIAWLYENLRTEHKLGSVTECPPPGEGPPLVALTAAITSDRVGHVVDGHLDQYWITANPSEPPPLSGGHHEPIYEPQRDASGNIVYDSNGVPLVLYQGGHVVDQRDELDPLSESGDSLVALDQAGNRSVIPLDPVPERFFFLEAHKPGCDASIVGWPLAPFAPETHGFDPKMQLVVGETLRTAPHEAESARFQYRRVDDAAWTDAPSFAIGPVGALRQAWSADFDELGLEPGVDYMGRFSARDGAFSSDSIQFTPCSTYALLTVRTAPDDDPNSSMMHVQANVSSILPEPVAFASLDIDGMVSHTPIHMTVPLVPSGDSGGLAALFFVPRPDCNEPILVAATLNTADQVYRSDGSKCLRLDASFPASFVVVQQEFPRCELASGNRVALKAAWSTLTPATARLETGPVDAPILVDEFDVATQGERELSWDVTGLPEGVVPLRASLTSAHGALCMPSPIGVPVSIDHTPPVVEIIEPPEGGTLCLNPQGGTETGTLIVQIGDLQSEGEYLGAEVRQGAGDWQALQLQCLECSPKFGGGIRAPFGQPLHFNWDIGALPAGAYTIRLHFCDRMGNDTTVERSLLISHESPYIAVVGTEPQYFSPNGDGQSDETVATFKTFQTMALTVQVHKFAANGPVVRSLADNQQLLPGDHAFPWDGRDGMGGVPPDGTYVTAIVGAAACGGTASASAAPVALDLTGPVAIVSSPPAGATLTGSTDVFGTADDDHFLSYALSYGVGNSPVSWTPIGGAGGVVHGGFLGHWDIPDASGAYTLRLLVADLAGNASEAFVPVTLGPATAIRSLSATPAIFSPNGDGRRETTTLEYELAEAGAVSLQVRDHTGAVLRTVETGVPHPPNEVHDFVWDGKKDDGTPASDGDLVVWLRVEDGVGGGQEQTIALTLDRVPPLLQIASPLPQSFHSRDESVHGSIQDPHLTSWTIAGGPPGTPPTSLGHGNQDRSDADLAPLAILIDGPQALAAVAEDAAENRSETSLVFTLDSVAPVVHLLSPANGGVVPRGSTPVMVTGSVTDPNLDHWVLGFGFGSAPVSFQDVAQGTVGGIGIPLASWSVASLPEGLFTLRLVGTDRASLVSEDKVTLTLDGTAPIATILSPPEGALLGHAVPITGTASDANIESWELHAAPGSAGTAYEWSLLASGTSSVTAGILAPWSPLPPDGSTTLRLTVHDRAGYQSAAFRTVTVDTTPPSPPSGLAASVSHGSGTTGDVLLSWTASPDSDVVGYLVERDGTTLTPDPVHATSFSDPGRSEGTYQYAVRAVDGAGNSSAPALLSVHVDLTPPLCDILRPTAGTAVSGSVDVKGTAFSPADFKEYRLSVGAGENPSAWTLLRESTLPVAAGLLGTWTAVGDGLYTLALEADDTSGNTARITVAVLVDNLPPQPPSLTSVVPLPGEPDSLVATWIASASSDVDGYLVYRNGRIANAPGIVLGDLRPYLVPGPGYADHGLPDGAQCYAIVAMDHAGNLSAPSNQECVSLDNRRPHAPIVQPATGLRFDYPLHVIAVTPDTDVTQVRFEIKPHAEVAWSSLGAPDTAAPYDVVLDPTSLALGDYDLRAVAEDAGGPDPAPGSITVTYGDATAPAAPSGLVAHVDGDQVSLAWNAGSEADLAGYQVLRDGTRLTTNPLAQPAFVDSAVPTAAHVYGVLSVDHDGNESAATEVHVLVYVLALNAPYPVTADSSTSLSGTGAQPATTVQVLSGALVVAEAAAGGPDFQIAPVPLAAGPNLLRARGLDSDGNLSIPSKEAVLISNAPPASVAGLFGSALGHDVALAWQPLADPEVFGYTVRRDGQVLTGESAQTTAESTSATATYPFGPYGPARAFDGDPLSLWMPDVLPATWTISFSAPILVDHVSLVFASSNGAPVAIPSYRIEAAWEDRLVPLASVSDNTLPVVDAVLPEPFATSALSITIDGLSFAGLAEVGVGKRDLVPAAMPAFADLGVPDGVHAYSVAAMDRYGAEAVPAGVDVPVGDVEPPAPPTGLAASVAGSDVTLVWNPSPERDLDHYVVLRDGAPIATTTAAAYLDPALVNGTYTYTVRAVDGVGNVSADSEPASATVAVPPPVAPVLSGSAPPSGFVDLSWTHPGAPAFAIYRAATAGGAGGLLALVGDVRGYEDTSAPLGVASYYVVRARDAMGNESPSSNEVAVTPERTQAPAAPAILSPTDAAHPIELQALATDVGGRALVGTVVSLVRGDALVATTLAVPDATLPAEVTSLVLPGEPVHPSLSSDGSSLVHEWSGGLRVIDVATGSSIDLLQPGRDAMLLPAFSVDGRRVSYAGATLDGATVVEAGLYWIDLAVSAITAVDETPGSIVGESAWSPDGGRLAYVSVAAGTNELRVADAQTGAQSLLGSWPDRRPAFLRWSPDGSWLALVLAADGASSGELVVVDATAGGAASSLSSTAWLGAASWSPDAAHLAYADLDLGVPRLVLRALDGSTSVPLTDGSLPDVDPRFDKAGSRLSFGRLTSDPSGVSLRTLMVLDLASGAIAAAAQPDPMGASEAFLLHAWTSDARLAIVSGNRLRFFIEYDGSFLFPQAALDFGENDFVARAADVQTGLVSPESQIVRISVPQDSFPDLALAADDLSAYPSVPRVGEICRVSARVRNEGGVGTTTAVKLTVTAPDGSVAFDSLLGTSVPAGGSSVVFGDWIAATPGTYAFAAVADPANEVAEGSEDNNSASREIVVAPAMGLVIGVSADREQYPANTPALVQATLTNAGADFQGTATTTVEAADGSLVATIDSRGIDLVYGESVSFGAPWNTGVTYSGSYAFRVRAVPNGNGNAMADGSVPFVILPDIRVSAQLVPQHATVAEGGVATFSAEVDSEGVNTPLSGLIGRLRITPAAGGPPLFESSASLPLLLPGGVWQGDLSWSPAMPVGSDVATLDVLQGPSVLASAHASFEVVPQPTSITGTLTLQPADILRGDDTLAHVGLSNAGETPAAGVEIAVEIVAPGQSDVLVEATATLDVPAHGQAQADITLATGGLAAGTYLSFLKQLPQAISLDVRPLHVHAPITPPSFDAPPNGAQVPTPHPTLSVNNASGGPGAVLTYIFELYADAGLTQPVSTASGVLEGPGRTAWIVPQSLQEGRSYFWRARATDAFSFSAWTSVASFVIEAENAPPTVPVPDTPLPGSHVATTQPILTVHNGHDPDGDTLHYDFRLAADAGMQQILASASGLPEGPGLTSWPQPLVLVEDQEYFWSARAGDGVSFSSWTEPVSFVVDSIDATPSVPVLLRPIGGVDAPTLTPELIVADSHDQEGEALSYSFQIDRVPSYDSSDLQVSPAVPEAPAETVWTPPVPLADNTTYYWRAAASDGHTASAWAQDQFFVNLGNDAPSVPVPQDPSDGSIVTTATPTLRVRDAADPDHDSLMYDFRVADDAGVEVTSTSGVPEAPNETAWTVDVPLAENGTFLWSARASDGQLTSEWSPPISFRVNAVVEPPTAPTLVAPAEGSVLDTATATLVVGNATSADGNVLTYSFELYRVLTGGELVLVDSVSGVPEGTGTTQWIPSGPLANADYSWRSWAVDAVQPGPPMASAHFTVNVDLPPSPPPSLQVASMRLQVFLSWSPSPDADVSAYRVYRSTTAGGPYALIATTPATSFEDMAPEYLVTLYYVVTALDASHESVPSPEVSVTPRPCLSNSGPEPCPHPAPPNQGIRE